MYKRQPYGSTLYAADGEVVENGKLIARWDPFNAVIITEATGKIEFEGVIENVTYKAVSYTHLDVYKRQSLCRLSWVRLVRSVVYSVLVD